MADEAAPGLLSMEPASPPEHSLLRRAWPARRAPFRSAHEAENTRHRSCTHILARSRYGFGFGAGVDSGPAGAGDAGGVLLPSAVSGLAAGVAFGFGGTG